MRWIFRREFGVYFAVGGVATVIDWGTFALVLWVIGKQHYLVAVCVSLVCAGLFHFIANKRLTFQCRSRAISKQIPVYIAVGLAGLGMSMVSLHILVGSIGLPAIIARIATTLLLLVPNYAMHKFLTFNKKIFI